MYWQAPHFREFYSQSTGRVIRRILMKRITQIWPNVSGQTILGYGYTQPYMRLYAEQTPHSYLVTSPRMAIDQGWGVMDRNQICIAEEEELPFETASIDRVLIIHSLEFKERVSPAMEEIWRVLKSNGRILIVVPNRNGLWARAEFSPFGHGTPYTHGQIMRLLEASKFVHENTEEALFMPPIRNSAILKSSGFFERYGKSVLPILPGVHLVEASKQIYSRVDKGSRVRGRVRAITDILPKPSIPKPLTITTPEDCADQSRP